MAARLQVIVDFPTPPFWLKMTLRIPYNEALLARQQTINRGITRPELAIRASFKTRADCYASLEYDYQ